MNEFSDLEIKVIYEALQEHADLERHEPYLFSENGRAALGTAFTRFHVEARKRKIVHV